MQSVMNNLPWILGTGVPVLLVVLSTIANRVKGKSEAADTFLGVLIDLLSLMPRPGHVGVTGSSSFNLPLARSTKVEEAAAPSPPSPPTDPAKS